MISKKSLLAITGALLALIYLSSSPFNLSEDAFQPDNEIKEGPVVLITMESVRADHVGPCYGYERKTAPNLCDLAEDGVLFDNAYSPGSWTSITVPSMIFSESPVRVGLQEWDESLPQTVERTAFGEKLSDEGYSTYRTGSHIYTETTSDKSLINAESINRGYKYRYPIRGDDPETIEGELPEEYLPNSKEDHLWDFPWHPHPLFEPPEEYMLWGPENYTGDLEDISMEMQEKPEEANISASKRLYDGEIRYTDETRIGPVVNHLKDNELYEDALIIVTSDHGVGFGEHDRYFHGHEPYNELTRVPLIVKFPDNMYSGEEVKTPVSLTDIKPTLCDILELRCSQNNKGQSLVETIDKEARNPVLTYGPWESGAAVIDSSFKYLLKQPDRNCYRERSNLSESNELLFNLTADPLEQNSITSKIPEKSVELREELCRRYKASYEARPEYLEDDIDETTRERLEKLGYLD